MKRNIKGLTAAEVSESRKKHGTNALIKEKRRGFFKRFIENLADPIIKVLIGAVVLEVILTLGHVNFLEVGGIVVAVLIATVVSVVSEMGSERAFMRLRENGIGTSVTAYREGKLVKIGCDEVVVGDILVLSVGGTVAADGVMIDGRVSVDQSALNGESEDVWKTSVGYKDELKLDSDGCVFRGSAVTGGGGIMRVLRVGGATFFGAVAHEVQTETRESPLKYRLGVLARAISRIGYIMALLVGLTYLFNTYIADCGFDLKKSLEALSDIPLLLKNLIHTLTLMITVVVVAVPEGLPMMITVILSANTKKMLRSGVLVKKLVGIETAGSLNILFTDKTGTLTTGKLECEAIVTRTETVRSAAALSRFGAIYEALLIDAKYNTDAVITNGEISGANATERALAAFFLNDECECDVIERKPFSSEDKYSYIRLKNGKIIIKGAAEMILARCAFSLKENSDAVADELLSVKRALREATERGERALAVATGYELDKPLTFVGLVLLKDKVRQGVREAVKRISGAGIQTVMLTGDGIGTARAIAAECGIYNSKAHHVAISSDELSRMTDGEVKAILPSLRVLARALPSDKTRLVRLSQEMGLVAGMTGDGINDAPSLKAADVGFAMGSGTDIAKGAADIVILDDSLDAIGMSVLYGRMIFKSIRKFITFQLIMNLAACGVSLFGQFIGIDNPITIIQMLWINIIMDTLGGLAFAGEPALDYYMKEKPKKREEKILTRSMLNSITLTGAYTLLLLVMFLRLDFFRDMYIKGSDTSVFLSAFYALFVFSGIVNAILARSERLWVFSGIRKNRLFIVIMLFIAAVQMVMIYMGADVFRTVRMSPGELLPVVLLSLSVIVFDFIRRIAYKLK